jgi:hypothetical protein
MTNKFLPDYCGKVLLNSRIGRATGEGWNGYGFKIPIQRRPGRPKLITAAEDKRAKDDYCCCVRESLEKPLTATLHSVSTHFCLDIWGYVTD